MSPEFLLPIRVPVAAIGLAALLVALMWFDGVAAQEFDKEQSRWTRPGTDWPRFLGSDIDGKSPETGILKDWTRGRLKVRWKFETGEGYAIGSVANGRFYHFGKYGDQSVLHCLNAETGKSLWEFSYRAPYFDLYQYDGGPRASPLIDGDRVYIYGVAGWLHCLNAATGKLIWKLDTMKQFGVVQNFFGVGSNPVVLGDRLLVMVGGSPEEDQKIPPGRLDQVTPNGSGIVALNKFTGQVEYQAVNDLASYSSLKPMSVGNQTLVLAWMRNALHGVEPETGKVVFFFPYRARSLESVNASTPVVPEEGQIFLSECYQLGSVLLKTDAGQVKTIWDDQGRRPALETHWNTPVVIGDLMFASSGRHAGDAELRCINWKTGELKWKHRGLGRASCTAVDGHLIVLGEYGDLQLIKPDPAGYRVVTEYDSGWEDAIRLRPPCWAAPVVSHGLLWVRGSRYLVCFDLKPGQN